MQSTVNRRLLRLTWPFIALVVTMVTLAVASIVAISAIRAYVSGESYWAKAERDATFHLVRFLVRNQDSDYQAFRRATEVIRGDYRARMALQSSEPDVATAIAGFLAGRNHPADLVGMVQLFQYFGNTTLLRRAIDLWTEADLAFLEMEALGEEIASRLSQNTMTAVDTEQYIHQVEALHRRLIPLGDAFNTELGASSRQVSQTMVIVLTVCALTLLVAAVWNSRTMLHRSEAISRALQRSQRSAHAAQERAQVTLQSIADAVVSVDRAGRIEYLNTAAEQLTGWQSNEAAGRLISEVLQLVDGDGADVFETQIERVLTDGVASELTHTSQLVHRDGHRIAVDERMAPIRDRDGDIVGLVLVMRDVTRERALASQLQYQATHDGLTGLRNREGFDQQLRLLLSESCPPDREHAVIMMDLDQFKIVNDTCGHAAGDELLRQIASLIIDRLPPRALLARLGGDEFGVLLPAIGLPGAIATADAIRDALALHRFMRDGKTFSTGASIGVVAIGADLSTPGLVLNAVDRACYMAKENGRNRVHVYRPDDQELRQRSGEMAAIAQLTSAIEDRRLLLYGQEIRALRPGPDGSTESHIELLVRMLGADGKLVPPGTFIPAAERYGLMREVDRWIIAQAFRTLSALRERNRPLPRCMINLSGQSLTDETLYDYLLTQFRQSGLPFERIGFEITETSAITNMIVAVDVMRRLRNLGCVIALDDFGSGMSSFTYLHSMPIDCLKIDGHLVSDFRRNPVHRVMVKAIHQIAGVMNIKTIAEWVEDEATCAELTRIGIDYAQGHFVARPEPLDDALEHWQQRVGIRLPAPSLSLP